MRSVSPWSWFPTTEWPRRTRQRPPYCRRSWTCAACVSSGRVPSVGLHLDDPEGASALRDRLNARLVHARAYLREELPEHLHARDNPRLGDLLVVPTGLGLVQLGLDGSPPAGMHGWDPTLPEMHGIFLAAGPGIAAGVRLAAVEAVDVYPLVTHMLGLAPPPDLAGDLAAFAPALESQTPP